jgi:hypothetical protein
LIIFTLFFNQEKKKGDKKEEGKQLGALKGA